VAGTGLYLYRSGGVFSSLEGLLIDGNVWINDPVSPGQDIFLGTHFLLPYCLL
jgi:hypothetical protein